ncbi:MAG: nucleotide sugar dehydrogenase [Alphaproteobacteria bacterium]|nr:nucleotide sugar dehydrogenase [Alphaproteobacteria bacterium]
MRISIFGLGYVGVVSAGCLAKAGHTIIGVDIHPQKIEQVNGGKSPIIEAQLGELLRDGVENNRISATADCNEAIFNTDLSLICVGTPSQANGNLDIAAIRHVCTQIGAAIKAKNQQHMVVIRSTILPGTTANVIIPILEAETGGKVDEAFNLAYNPEFLREGTAVDDFFSPPKTVIGVLNDKAAQQVTKLYDGIDAPLIVTTIDISEMVKYADNVWHGLKVCFGNEIGNICQAQGIDSHKVMDIFCQDTKLNLSPNYLKPGFAFGGSCLPKDTRALTYQAKQLGLNLPLIESILTSNQQQIQRAISIISSKNKTKITVLGFTFKAGTDDLRESPLVELIERLIAQGYELKLFDKNVSLDSLIGLNKQYILNAIPHIDRLMVDTIDEAIKGAEIVIVGNNAQEFADIPSKIKSDQCLVDFVRLENTTHLKDRYIGINWIKDTQTNV